MKFVLAFFVLALVDAVPPAPIQPAPAPPAEETSTFFGDELLGPLESIQTTLRRMKYAKEDFEILEGKLEVLNRERIKIRLATDTVTNSVDVTGYNNDFTHET